jgi:hypothetical protein
VIVCRKCSRRHPDGTEFCPCGAYLEFDGERVADASDALAPPPTAAATTTAADPWAAPAEQKAPQRAGAAVPSEPAPWSGFDTPTTPTPATTRAGGGDIDAVLPDAPTQPVAGPVPVVETARAGDIVCGACGTPNAPDRYFCRHCGAAIAGAAAARTTAAAQTDRVPWWRRLGRSARRKAGSVDPSSLSRMTHDVARGGISRRTMLFRGGGILLLLGGLLAFLGPWRGTVINRGRDVIGATRYEAISLDPSEVSSEAADPAAEPAQFDMQDASNLVDRFANTAWATRWTNALGPGFTEAPTDGGCQPEPMTDSVVRIDLAEPTDLARIRILPGRPDADPSRTLFGRPRVIELQADDGDCEYIVLDDAGELAVFPFDHDDVSTVTLRIVGIFEPESPNETVEISEIVLDR